MQNLGGVASGVVQGHDVQHVTGLAGGGRSPVDELARPGLEHAGDQGAQPVRASRGQRGGRRVASVPQSRDRGPDPFTGRRARPGLVVEHARDGLVRHAGQPRHVEDVCRARRGIVSAPGVVSRRHRAGSPSRAATDWRVRRRRRQPVQQSGAAGDDVRDDDRLSHELADRRRQAAGRVDRHRRCRSRCDAREPGGKASRGWPGQARP